MKHPRGNGQENGKERGRGNGAATATIDWSERAPAQHEQSGGNGQVGTEIADVQQVRTVDDLVSTMKKEYGIVLTGDRDMLKITRKIALFAPIAQTIVLIKGESGVGKEGLAIMVHEASGREGTLVTLNCAGIQESIAENELFGHHRGAYTDARDNHKGCFERADGGTLFLDEIGDLPTGIQAKFLRVLDRGEFTPLGGTEPKRVNVKVVCATNRPLEALVKKGTFREDLYHRINDCEIEVPPLRARQETHRQELIVSTAERIGRDELGIKGTVTLSKEVMDALKRTNFRGNVRELLQILRRAIRYAQEGNWDDPVVQLHHVAKTNGSSRLDDDNSEHTPAGNVDYDATGVYVHKVDDQPFADYTGQIHLSVALGDPESLGTRVELTVIQALLKRRDQIKSAVARDMRIERSTLDRKIAEYERKYVNQLSL